MTRPASSFDFHKTTLPGGLRVLTEKHEGVRSVTLGLWIEAGSIYETTPEAGLAHLLEHMVFKGTRRHSMSRIAAIMDELGGTTNAFTEREHVCYHIKVLSDGLPRAFELLSEFITQPLLDEELLEVEKSVVLEEIRSAEDAPEEMVEEMFVENFWAKSRWGRPILGAPETVEAFETEHLRKFMARQYSPQNCVVVAVGDVQHDKIVRLAQKHLADLPGHNGGPLESVGEPQATPARIVKRDETESAHLVIGGPSWGYGDERRHAARLLDTILTGGYSSRLFQEVREKRGWCYSIGSAGASYRGAGYWAVGTSVAPQNATKVARLIARELKRVREDGVRPGELKRAKQMARVNILLSEESSSAQMGRLARHELYFGRQRSTEEALAVMENVTSEEVQAVAQQMFEPNAMSLAAIGPIRGELEI